jgi:hypothetical protein
MGEHRRKADGRRVFSTEFKRRRPRCSTPTSWALERPVSYLELRGNMHLRQLGAVRRKFRGTCFQVDPEYWRGLRGLVEARIKPAVEKGSTGR